MFRTPPSLTVAVATIGAAEAESVSGIRVHIKARQKTEKILRKRTRGSSNGVTEDTIEINCTGVGFCTILGL
jgi:hypothetical protein